jgi:hypothetical protein
MAVTKLFTYKAGQNVVALVPFQRRQDDYKDDGRGAKPNEKIQIRIRAPRIIT